MCSYRVCIHLGEEALLVMNKYEFIKAQNRGNAFVGKRQGSGWLVEINDGIFSSVQHGM